MADQNTAQAFLLANSAAQVYESVVIHPLEYYSEVLSAEETKRIPGFAAGVLGRSARRLAEFRDQEFSKWVLSRAVQQNAEAA